MKNVLQSLLMQARMLVSGHVLNPLWLPHDERRKRRKTVIADAKVRYLDIFRKEVIDFIPSDNDVSGIDSQDERVFTLWLQGESQAPPIVKACIRSMRKHIDMPVEVLDETNILDWISFPDYIIDKWKSGIISRTHFSDICRIELLFEHGGIWADATDFFTAPIPDEIMHMDFFLFMAGDNLKLGGTHAFIQSCFMRMKKGNPLLGMWRQFLFLYWKKEDKLLDYFTLHFLFRYLVENNVEAASLFSKMPRFSSDPTHVLFWQHKDSPYSADLFSSLTQPTFFQKTTYKDPSAKDPKSGSMAEYIINS